MTEPLDDATIQRIAKAVVEETRKQCVHKYEEVGGRNSNYRVYYNMASAYIVCEKCGQRKRV